jgi:outer membrane protein assembly factor BamB
MAVGAGAAAGADWPRFLGPNASGVVEGGEKVARTWPSGGPREIWRIDVGEGFGGAAIVGGKVFLLDRDSTDHQDIFHVLDLKSGNSIWEHKYSTAAYKGSFPGNRSTPTVEGERVYTVGVVGDVRCFDVAERRVIWGKSLSSDFGAEPGDWGFAQSALVVRNMVILSVAGGPNGLVALDKQTGRTLWKTPAFGRTDTYTSPMLTTIGGEEHVLMWHRGVLGAFDPDDGTELWRYEWRTNRPIPQPVPLGEGRFFLTIGYGAGCAMIEVERPGGATGGAWRVKQLFQDTRSASKTPPALLYQGHIYTNSDDNKRGLQCLDRDGAVKWETQRSPAFGLGNMIIADGVIFIVNGDSGDLVMAEASPQGYKELGRARVLGGKDIWAPLALSDGMLVLRDQKQMKCVHVGAGG